MSFPKALAFACLVGLAACDEPTPTHSPQPPPPAAKPRQIEKTITWPSAPVDESARAALSAEARAAVDRAPVPVLVVNQPALLVASKVIARENFYALSTQADGVTVSLSATRIAHRYDHIPPQEGPSRVRGKPAFVTQNEAIWSAAWNENGAAYALDVECSKLPDPRCEDERFVLELAESLAYVGGRGESP